MRYAGIPTLLTAPVVRMEGGRLGVRVRGWWMQIGAQMQCILLPLPPPTPSQSPQEEPKVKNLVLLLSNHEGLASPNDAQPGLSTLSPAAGGLSPKALSQVLLLGPKSDPGRNLSLAPRVSP